MFINVTPEQAGIDPARVLSFFKTLEEKRLFMHSVLLARGDKIFAEAYWKPYHAQKQHRIYSSSKSWVGVAVAQLAADGKIGLDDRIIDYFPDKLPPREIHPYMREQTVRHMLTMQTCAPYCGWQEFCKSGDRVKVYFDFEPERAPGCTFVYDSNGTFVLGALVERVTGMTVLDYLRRKGLDKAGFSPTARMLKCPGGHSWSDSALICTPRDSLLFLRVLANGGTWEGERIFDENAVREACAKHVETSKGGLYTAKAAGYGWQIWRCYGNSWCFNGMHDQHSVYDPDTDISFVCTAGDRRDEPAGNYIFEALFRDIIRPANDPPKKDPAAQKELEKHIASLSVLTSAGDVTSPAEKEISGRTFKASPNRAGMTEFSFTFGGGECVMRYVNAQGDKLLRFGMGKNVFQKFPQEGWSAEIAGTPCPGNKYDCLASAGWIEPRKLALKAQIVDDYIGVLDMTAGFDGGRCVLELRGDGKDYLEDHNCWITGE